MPDFDAILADIKREYSSGEITNLGFATTQNVWLVVFDYFSEDPTDPEREFRQRRFRVVHEDGETLCGGGVENEFGVKRS
jgi:hypothetical protein